MAEPEHNPLDTLDLLHDFLTSPHPAVTLCREHGITPTDLLAWLESPEIAAQLDALEALEHTRRRAAQARAAHAAVERLRDLVLHPPTDEHGHVTPRAAETARKAAAQLLREAPTPPADTPNAQPDVDATAETEPAPEPRATHGTPEPETSPDPATNGHHAEPPPVRAPP